MWLVRPRFPSSYDWTRKVVYMNWNFLISFGVAVAIYVIVVLIIGFIKKRKKYRIKDDKQDDTDKE